MKKYKNGIPTHKVIRTRSVVHVNYKKRVNRAGWVSSRIVTRTDLDAKQRYWANIILSGGIK